MLLVGLIAYSSCQENAPPTPTPATLPDQISPTSPATEAMATVLPTAVRALATSSTVTTSNLVTVASAGGLTPTTPLSSSVTSVGESMVACSQEPDIALASFPDLAPLMGCAQEPAVFHDTAINEFGPGPDFDRFMLWFSQEQQIYVLLPDHHWQSYPDTWSEKQAIYTCNPLGGEPASPPLPRRGFGKLWCTVDGLQEILGTIVLEERLCQHAVLQRFERGRLLACYEDATIRYFRIMDNGEWDQMLTQ